MTQSNILSQNKKHFDSIHFLRGFASLWVCWHHLASVAGLLGISAFLADDWLGWTVKNGNLGIAIFFVLSGFIIPWSMYKAHYKVHYFAKYLLKRVIRLHPTYLLSIFIALFISFIVTVKQTGTLNAFSINASQLVTHLFLIVPFFDYDWYVGPYWTLAIEFQYYIFVGLLFPFVVSKHFYLRIFFLFIFFAMDLIFTVPNLLFHWAGLFCFGIITFQYKSDIIGTKEYIFSIIICCTISYSTYPLLHSLAGLLTALFVGFYGFQIKISRFWGNISYSLYVVHYPIGLRVLGFIDDYTINLFQKILALIVAFTTVILFAYLSYRFTERPSMDISKRIKYDEPINWQGALHSSKIFNGCFRK